MRKSSVLAKNDSAGDYEVEIFDCPDPKRAIVCLHGRGVRRWDGENFFCEVAEHFADSAVLLVDQFQPEGDVIKLNPMPILVKRVEGIIEEANRLHPDVPIVMMAHSNGAGVATFVDTKDVRAIVLVTPAAGKPHDAYVKRYGQDIINGKTVLNQEGAKVNFTSEFIQSMQGIEWEDRYADLVKRFTPTYVFEGGSDNIIGEERFALRDIPFTQYFILDGAPHNLTGKYLEDFFAKLDPLLSRQ